MNHLFFGIILPVIFVYRDKVHGGSVKYLISTELDFQED
jgi:hypothetical protein